MAVISYRKDRVLLVLLTEVPQFPFHTKINSQIMSDNKNENSCRSRMNFVSEHIHIHLKKFWHLSATWETKAQDLVQTALEPGLNLNVMRCFFSHRFYSHVIYPVELCHKTGAKAGGHDEKTLISSQTKCTIMYQIRFFSKELRE